MSDSKRSVRKRIISVRLVDGKHYYYFFGRPAKTLSRFSTYLCCRDLKHRIDLESKRLDEAKNELTAKYDSIQKLLRIHVLHDGRHHINKESVASKIENFNASGINEKLRTPKIIISLTSFPERMYDIHYCLYSLLTQSLKPDMVILWLAREQFPNGEDDIPQKVLKLKDNGLTIDWCHDIKSYKKLIPALQEYPDDMIVTADDDIFYSEDWLETLYTQYDGSKDIFCHRVHKVGMEGDRIIPYKEWKRDINDTEDSLLNFPTSGGGVLFPPRSLYKDVTKEEVFLSLSPNADDIWLWAMALLAGRKIKIIKLTSI